MKNIKFSIPVVFNFTFELISFNPARDICKGWGFGKLVSGLRRGNGVTSFSKVIARAATLSKEEGYKLLFASGVAEGKRYINWDERVKALAKRKLADPDLLWSLLHEKEQKTLRYLHDTYGVVWMESLRRSIRNPSGFCHNLYLFRKDGTGLWSWGVKFHSVRSDCYPALVLGE